MVRGNQSNDPRSSPEGQALLKYKSQLTSMRDMLLFGTDLRGITTKNVDLWEADLRDILKGIKNLTQTSHQYDLLDSTDALQKSISMVIKKLYLVSDILQKRSTLRDREKLYETLHECSYILADAIERFKI